MNFTNRNRWKILENNTNISNWNWSFGNNSNPNNSNLENPPSISYSSKGFKEITLNINDIYGCSSNDTLDLEIFEANASFTSSTNVGCAPGTVPFSNTSIDTKAWEWNFGDTLSPLRYDENPTNIYFYPGIYDITLITTSIGGCKDTVVKSPGAILNGAYYDSVSYSFNNGQCIDVGISSPEVTFKLFGLHDTKTLEFDFGDGSPSENIVFIDQNNLPDSVVIIHNYISAGVFKPKVTLSDDITLSTSCGSFLYELPITPIIISKNPEANFIYQSSNNEGCQNKNLKFFDKTIESGGLLDPNYPIVSWNWEFDDGGFSSLKNPSHKYVDTGFFEVTMEVITSFGCSDIDTNLVYVLEEIHDPSVASNDSICEGDSVVLVGQLPQGGNGNFSYLWQVSTNGNNGWNNASGVNDSINYKVVSNSVNNIEILYYRRKSISSACIKYSDVYSVTTFPNTVPGNLFSSRKECYGINSGTLILNGYTGNILEWQSSENINFSPYSIIPNTNTSYSYSNLIDTTFFRVIVKSGVCSSMFSDTAIIDVVPEITGNQFSTTDSTYCVGEVIGVLQPSSPTGGNGVYAYEWYFSLNNVNYQQINGVTTESYSPGGVNQKTYYKRVVYSDGCDYESNIFTANIISNPDLNITIEDIYVCAESIPATVDIILKSSEVDVQYQLRRNSDNSPIGFPQIGNGNDLVFNVITPLVTTEYNFFAQSIINNGNGNLCSGIELSDIVTIFIAPIPDNSLDLSDPILCESTTDNSFDIMLSNSEINVDYTLRNNGVDIQTISGNGSDIIFTITPIPSNSISYDVFAKSNLNNNLCSEFELTDNSNLTIIPEPDHSLFVSDPEVCFGDGTFIIDIENTSSDVDYSLVLDGVGYTQSLTGNNGTLSFTEPEPTNNVIYKVYAKPNLIPDNGLCDSVLLQDESNVIFSPMIIDNLIVIGDTVCVEDNISAKVTILNSQNNISYQLRDGINNIGAPLSGNGGNIIFNNINPSITTSYNILATSEVIANCSSVELINNPTIEVIGTPLDLPILISPSPANLCSGESFDITIVGTENNVIYTLKRDNQNILGQQIIGDGMDQFFTIVSDSSSIYTVSAKSNKYQAEGYDCSSFELSTQLSTNVEGPISIINQPIEANVCAGTKASFSVDVQNLGEGTILYQWYESSDNISFLPISDGPDFNGVNSPNLEILNITGKENYFYRVNVSTNLCNTIISNSAHIEVSALPDINNFIFTIDDICLGNDGILNYSSNLLPNNYYKVFYQATGFNGVSYDSLEFYQSNIDGSGSGVLLSSSLTNIGSTALIITEIDYVSGYQCKSASFVSSDIFDVEPLPDTTSFTIKIDNVCYLDSAIVELSFPSIIDNVYSLNYSLSGVNTFSENVLISFINGTAEFYIPKYQLQNTGINNVDFQDLKYIVGQNCGVDLNYSTSFTVNKIPDTTNLDIQIPDICSTKPLDVFITGNLVDSNYVAILNLSGANTEIDTVSFTLNSGNGNGHFQISNNYFKNSGNTRLEITDLFFDSISSCSVNSIGIFEDFNIEQTPDSSNIDLVIPDICEGDSATVLLTSLIENGDYSFVYRLSGSGLLINDTLEASIISGNGTALFYIPDNYLQTAGFYNLALLEIFNNNGLNCSSPINNLVTSFTVESNPDTSSFSLLVNDICQNQDAFIIINSQLPKGEYVFHYYLTGENDNFSNFETITIDSLGESSFIIPGLYLSDTGETNIIIDKIQNNSGQDCETGVLSIVSSFNVQPILDIKDLNLSANNICVFNNQNIDISTSLPNGDYEINFLISGINDHQNLIDTINVNNGLSNLLINQNLLAYSGLTTITIFKIQYLHGAKCSSISSETSSVSFNVEDKPNVYGLNIYAQNVCKGDDVPVLITSNLIDGDYTMYFSLSGRNQDPSDSVSFVLNSGDGNHLFNIPTSLVPVEGATTIIIEGIKFNAGQMCEVKTFIQSNFLINPLPITDSLYAHIDNVCINDTVWVEISSSLSIGKYSIVYDLNGVNLVQNGKSELNINDTTGKGRFYIPFNEVMNTGQTDFTINRVISDDAVGGCTSIVPNNISSFTIESLPDVSDFSISIYDVCLGFNAEITVKSSSLPDGFYKCVIDVTGINTYALDTVDIQMFGGIGLVTIPSDSLLNSGVSTFHLQQILSSTSNECSSLTNESIGFNVYPDPGTNSLLLETNDICSGNSENVKINSVFPNGDYLFIYDLIGANNYIGIKDTVTFNSIDGVSSFIIPDSLLNISGQQLLKITEIQVLGFTPCSSTGLDIKDSFNIEGPIIVDSIIQSDPLCSGYKQTIDVFANNNGFGSINYQWFLSDGDKFNELKNQGIYSGVNSHMLSISDNTSINNFEFFCSVSSKHCLSINSDTVITEVLYGSICGDGIEKIPNAISPNGDGVNDLWVIEGIENYPGNFVQLFNRWGEVIFEANGYDNLSIVFEGVGNKGFGNGKDVADGTYYYLVKLNDNQGILTGFFVINR